MGAPRIVALRPTDPPMGERDGNSELVRAVQARFKVLEVDGSYGPRTRAAVARWQWRVGAPNHKGAIPPVELVVLLGYRKPPREWRKAQKARLGKENPWQPPAAPPRRDLEFVPYEKWCNIPWGGLSYANHPAGMPHVVHWFGPGSALDDDAKAVEQAVGFAKYHRYVLGWSGFAYNFAVLRSGLILVGRGANKRSAATGNNVGNTYPSVLLMAGTGTPEATKVQLETLQAMREHFRWGRRLNHLELSATSCPGPMLAPWVRAHR